LDEVAIRPEECIGLRIVHISAMVLLSRTISVFIALRREGLLKCNLLLEQFVLLLKLPLSLL
jgi:hypothetical protein